MLPVRDRYAGEDTRPHVVTCCGRRMLPRPSTAQWCAMCGRIVRPDVLARQRREPPRP